MKSNNIIALLAVGALLYAGTASAGLWTVQGSAGHIWPAANNGTFPLTPLDGQISTSVFTDGSPFASGSAYWVIPFELSTTNTLYTGTQSATGNVKTRLVSFAANGAVFGAGTSTSSAAIGSVTVPTDGTLFAQSVLSWSCVSSVCSSGALRQVKVTF